MGIEYRRFRPEDTRNVYRVFRNSVWDYVEQIGLVLPDDSNDIEGSWKRQASMMLHLNETADQDWVALAGGEIVGWARSIERAGHVQLTHFFVNPSTQGQGVGRGLLERAMPIGWGEERSILATQNPLALGLYLKFGVASQGISFDLYKSPTTVAVPGDLTFKESDDIEAVVAMEQGSLGYDRSVDLEFLARDRPLFLVYRGAALAGYFFGSSGAYIGPATVSNPGDMPGVLAYLENQAAESGTETFHFTIPGVAHEGVRWALANGYRIDPFYEMLLTSRPMNLSGYLMTQPSFIW